MSDPDGVRHTTAPPTTSHGQQAGGEPGGRDGEATPVSGPRRGADDPETTGSQAGEPGGGRSGLRDPVRAMRGLGAMTLALEALTLLLAILPIRMTQGGITGPQLGVLLGAVVVAVLCAGMLRRRWAWRLGGGLQLALLAGGVLHWMLAAVGVVYGLVWLYVLHVRRTVTSGVPG